MADQSTQEQGYTMGYSDEFLQLLDRRSAQSHAGHLLAHLKPGDRVLDFGCGPGTITVGLAEAVEPGEVHGIDMEESQVSLARAAAEAGEHGNAVFHVGDVTDLKFEDNFFDVAHCRNVLMHVPDTAAVLAEVKRVLKPGGIIACREMIIGSGFSHPELGILGRSWDMFEDLIRENDGHPQMGKDLKGHIQEAGFADLGMNASFSVYSSPEEIAFMHSVIDRWFLSQDVMEAAVKYGASTEGLVNDLRVAFNRWKDHPAAFFAFAYGEAIARKPLF